MEIWQKQKSKKYFFELLETTFLMKHTSHGNAHWYGFLTYLHNIDLWLKIINGSRVESDIDFSPNFYISGQSILLTPHSMPTDLFMVYIKCTLYLLIFPGVDTHSTDFPAQV